MQAGKKEALAHHGLIKLIVCDLSKVKNHQVSWEEFKHATTPSIQNQ